MTNLDGLGHTSVTDFTSLDSREKRKEKEDLNN